MPCWAAAPGSWRCSARYRCACPAGLSTPRPFGRTAQLPLPQALADRRQWYLNASWLVQGGLVFMVTVHIVPFALDQGVSLAVASLALTAYGIGAFIGRLAS